MHLYTRAHQDRKCVWAPRRLATQGCWCPGPKVAMAALLLSSFSSLVFPNQLSSSSASSSASSSDSCGRTLAFPQVRKRLTCCSLTHAPGPQQLFWTRPPRRPFLLLLLLLLLLLPVPSVKTRRVCCTLVEPKERRERREPSPPGASGQVRSRVPALITQPFPQVRPLNPPRLPGTF